MYETSSRTVLIPTLSKQLLARTFSFRSESGLFSFAFSSDRRSCWRCPIQDRQSAAGAVVLNEGVQVLAQDLGGFCQSHLGIG